MAEVLEDFDFTRSGRGQHPWDEWFNGKVWKLTRGEDFQGATKNFRITAYTAAKERNLKIQTRILNDQTFILQVVGPAASSE